MRKVFAILVMVGLVGLYYFYSDDMMREQIRTSPEMEKIMTYDLENEYPTTSKEVMLVYNQILTYLYSGKIKTSDIEEVVAQEMELFHKELLEVNPADVMVERLKLDIAAYKKANKKIIGSAIKEITPDDYYGKENQLCRIKVVYYLTEDKNPNINVYEEFILRKNEKGFWKILGWQETEEFGLVKD